MMKALALVNQAITFSKEEQGLIRDQLFPKELSDAHFKVYLAFCAKKRLDPIQRQVHAVARMNRKTNKLDMAIQTSIDGYRAIAARTGEYAGQGPAIFDNELQPKKATVTVYRIVKGAMCSFSGEAYWDEFFPGDNAQGFMWKSKPHLMLSKCAESQALRRGFPEELSGIYTEEEMAQAEPLPMPPAPLPKSTIPKEVRAMDAEFSQIIADAAAVQPPEERKPGSDDLDEKLPPAKEDLISRQSAIMNSLIGSKGQPFKNQIGKAKEWLKKTIGHDDFLKLTEEQCVKVEAAIPLLNEIK